MHYILIVLSIFFYCIAITEKNAINLPFLFYLLQFCPKACPVLQLYLELNSLYNFLIHFFETTSYGIQTSFFC